ncbi:hypothetical protein [Nocardia goodfellowii]|uniref:Quercetin dioxygenase-like cupin family protein n=1 Tax=Nocardia goodfellowii TaxID=882446 RepID=A0ABS4QL64_9NOCA|nr:hypothetical protein [Nocardia goodfellowii]MBP2192451.1 quercetin dioxygenase-like cupin family protein [Nocardia goodfellowii]
MKVIEDVVVMGTDSPLRSIERDEEQLLASPHPSKAPIKLWRDQPPLNVVHFPQQFRAQPFAPPRGVYESEHIRVEWQTMDNRQPFYHRNCDVDEISYQIAGERTLMTELGVIEHRPGEFSRIPRGVAHDNYGRKESHLLFYIPAPVAEVGPSVGESQPLSPPFDGWRAGAVNEAVTQCMGARGHDIAVFPIDEQLLLDQVHHEKERIQVLRGTSDHATTWLYGTDRFRLGVHHDAAGNQGVRYRRLLDGDTVHYQVSGSRTLISQRGIVDLAPGDFVQIPLGVAYASVNDEPGEYITLLSHRELPQVADTTRTADPWSPERLAAARAKAGR